MKKVTASDIAAMTDREKARFKVCTENLIEVAARAIRAERDAINAQYEAGCILIEVLDSKLYRGDYKTFEDYCTTVAKISRSRAYQLIEMAKIKKNLPAKLGDKITKESQARALASVPESKLEEVVKEASKNGEITIKSITAAVDQFVYTVDKEKPIESGVSSNGPAKNVKSKPAQILDEIGTPIPSDALPFWNRKQEIQDLLTEVSRLKCAIEEGKTSGDPMFNKVSQSIIAHMTQTYSLLQEAKPYAVCTTCMGSFSVQPKGCSFCGNKGLISKWQWDTQSRKEIKEIRLKSNASIAARA